MGLVRNGRYVAIKVELIVSNDSKISSFIRTTQHMITKYIDSVTF